MNEKRILSGFRPTGKIHIGNYLGSLKNWVKLQDDYKCYFLVADIHSLTTDFRKAEDIRENTIEMVKDWIAAGIDPEKSIVFVQSAVSAHSELHLIFSMLTPVSWLERNPTLKEQARDLDLSGKMSYGLLGYPVLQASDILLYRPDAVPVGEDQLPHLELTREIARRFNTHFKEIFPEPKGLLTKAARVPGLDGKKMSKSIGNTILLTDSEEEIEKKVKQAYTDPTRIRKTDPGHPEGCVVFAYHKFFNEDEVAQIESDCKAGKIGCVACKKNVAQKIAEALAPIREKRKELDKKEDYVFNILEAGNKKADKFANETLNEVKETLNFWINKEV